MSVAARTRSALVNLALLGLVAVLLFGVCEALTRMLYRGEIGLSPRYHTSAQYGEVTLRRIRPNWRFTHTTADGSWEFRTNAQGFRNDQDFSYEKPAGRVRIVALGDSHTLGYECQQEFTFSAVIERYLRNAGYDAEVMNTGVSGFSTAEALALLEHELVRYAPDFVVLGFYANDYEDNLKAGLFRLEPDGSLRMMKQSHVPGVWVQDLIYAIPGVKWLGENSYFYSLAFNTTWQFFKLRLKSRAAAAGEAADQQMADVEEADEMAVASKTNFSSYEVGLSAALIEKMAAVSHRAGARFVLIDVPRFDGMFETVPSVVEALLPVTRAADHFVGNGVLARFEGVAPFHVPHGGRHITEFTHTLIGVDAARYMQATLAQRAGQGVEELAGP